MVKVIQICDKESLSSLNDELATKLKNYPIIKMGIQGPPGLEFVIGRPFNEDEKDSDPCFKIGYTGIFTFDFKDLRDKDNAVGIANMFIRNNDKNNNLLANIGCSEIIIDIFYSDTQVQ